MWVKNNVTKDEDEVLKEMKGTASSDTTCKKNANTTRKMRIKMKKKAIKGKQ